MKNDYLPVAWDFRESIEEATKTQKNGTIHYFDSKDKIESANGSVKEVIEVKDEGEFLVLDSNESIRLDKIITLYGKPGPAYEKYDGFANACLDCMGGYDL